MRHVLAETGQTRPKLKTGEGELVAGDSSKTDQRHLQRVTMEQRNTKQRQRKQKEIDRNCVENTRIKGRHEIAQSPRCWSATFLTQGLVFVACLCREASGHPGRALSRKRVWRPRVQQLWHNTPPR